MKHSHKHLIAAALLALGFAASAQPAAPQPTPGPGPGGHHHGMMGDHGRMDPSKMQERMQQRREQRQAQLKQKLQITSAQEGAWTAYVAAMQPPANMQRQDREELAKLTTPERIDRMRALRDAHHAEMDRRGEATKTFYNALTAEQKKVFDAQSWSGRRGGHRHGHHRGHHA